LLPTTLGVGMRESVTDNYKMEDIVVADERNVDSSSASFSILANGAWTHRRESLLASLEKLEQAALGATNDDDRECYTIATILCAHAASEAFLSEWAKTHAPSTYEEIAGRQSSLLRAAEEVLPKIGAPLSADLIELANVRNALCNPSPADGQTPLDGGWHPSAQRAAAVAKALHSQCFPAPSPLA
jgi:hypothetical protein